MNIGLEKLLQTTILSRGAHLALHNVVLPQSYCMEVRAGPKGHEGRIIAIAMRVLSKIYGITLADSVCTS